MSNISLAPIAPAVSSWQIYIDFKSDQKKALIKEFTNTSCCAVSGIKSQFTHNFFPQTFVDVFNVEHVTHLVTSEKQIENAKLLHAQGILSYENLASIAIAHRIPIFTEQDFIKWARLSPTLVSKVTSELQPHPVPSIGRSALPSAPSIDRSVFHPAPFGNKSALHFDNKSVLQYTNKPALHYANKSALLSTNRAAVIVIPPVPVNWSFRKGISPFDNSQEKCQIQKTRITRTPGIKLFCELCGKSYVEDEEEHVESSAHRQLALSSTMYQCVDDAFEQLEEMDCKMRFEELILENQQLLHTLATLLQKQNYHRDIAPQQTMALFQQFFNWKRNEFTHHS